MPEFRASSDCEVVFMNLTRAGLIGAPLCLFGYGVIRLFGRLDGRYGPGPDWQAAHIVDLVGLVLFVPAVLGLGRALGDARGRRIVVAGTLVGVAASAVQITVDIVAGLRASDKAGMNAITGRFGSLPGAELAFYQVGPQLLYVGLIVLAIMLARAGTLPWWSAVLVFIGVAAPAVSLDLIPIGAVCLLVALAPLTLRLGDRAGWVTMGT
jgi:hypothetical protein